MIHNHLTANIVKLDIAAFGNHEPAPWRATTIAYEGVHPNSHCLLIWDEQKQEQVEYRPCEIGTATECETIAAQWNGLK